MVTRNFLLGIIAILVLVIAGGSFYFMQVKVTPSGTDALTQQASDDAEALANNAAKAAQSARKAADSTRDTAIQADKSLDDTAAAAKDAAATFNDHAVKKP